MDMTNERLAAIEARAKAATPGPWGWNDEFGLWPRTDGTLPDSRGDYPLILTRSFDVVAQGREFFDDSEFPRIMASCRQKGLYVDSPIIKEDAVLKISREDADFIVQAREDVPALVAEVRCLRTLLGL